MLASRLADEMEARFGAGYEEFVELLGAVRDTIRVSITDISARRAAAAGVLDREEELRALLASGHRNEALDLAVSSAMQAAHSIKRSSRGDPGSN